MPNYTEGRGEEGGKKHPSKGGFGYSSQMTYTPGNPKSRAGGKIYHTGKLTMEQLATSLLVGLRALDSQKAPHEFLQQVADLLQKTVQAPIVVAYQLISETGGIPRLPPVVAGSFEPGDKFTNCLMDATHMGALSELIRGWCPYYEADAHNWATVRPHPLEKPDFATFLAIEQITAFAFLPIAQQSNKLAAVLILYRTPHSWAEVEQCTLEAFAALVGTFLARMSQMQEAVLGTKNRMAMAHTRYGEVALLFKGQIDALREGIRGSLGENIPPDLIEHLASAENTVFEVMRKLVIEASGDMLVNLETMPLAKALNTAAAALRRAWSPDIRIMIDVPPIPLVIERQSLELRRLLYTLILEAIGNAIKHGGPASYIHVDVSWEDNQVFVQVIDHGVGFDCRNRPFSEHGLGFWQHYVENHLAGAFTVSSQPGYGTVINACIPVIPAKVE